MIEKARSTNQVWRDLADSTMGGAPTASLKEPKTMTEPISQHPSSDPVTTALREALETQTEVTRGIEAAKIKSLIPPMLADHIRREMLKFADELERAG